MANAVTGANREELQLQHYHALHSTTDGRDRGGSQGPLSRRIPWGRDVGASMYAGFGGGIEQVNIVRHRP